jgi:hypothetical protein
MNDKENLRQSRRCVAAQLYLSFLSFHRLYRFFVLGYQELGQMSCLVDVFVLPVGVGEVFFVGVGVGIEDFDRVEIFAVAPL